MVVCFFRWWRAYGCCLFFLLLAGVPVTGSMAQDSVQIRRWMDTLASPSMHGRGYVNGGMDSAAAFLERALQRMGLEVSSQTIRFPVNVFPGKVSLVLNDRKLKPGIDFLVSGESAPFQGKVTVSANGPRSWSSTNGRLIIDVSDTLVWNPWSVQQDFTRLLVRSQVIPRPLKTVEADIEAEWHPRFMARNIIARVPGTRRPDSLLLFIAHYDHVGRMGVETLFPGANDNATGTATLLALAARIAQHPLPYTAEFVFFAGEEMGLSGSIEYVSATGRGLRAVRFLVNLDLVGDGEDGMTVVNAPAHPEAFKILQELNARHQWLPQILSRTNAPNSDHFPFTEVGVPAFFWYTLGKRKAYHDVYDVPSTVPLYKASALVSLLDYFARAIIDSPR